MLFKNVDNDTKLQILKENLSKYEEDIYGQLLRLGVDPESFDSNNYSLEDIIKDATDIHRVNEFNLLKKMIDFLNALNKEISSLSE